MDGGQDAFRHALVDGARGYPPSLTLPRKGEGTVRAAIAAVRSMMRSRVL
ncbi:hypothetical protein BRAS3809_3230010 [Bradyrhizobium sp. STM 3809]|nr:hypothetical protein BRAS3809_3230010 [Bradyrhizobium sp. STM 3809]